MDLLEIHLLDFTSLYYSYIRENGKVSIEEFIQSHEEWDYFFDTQTDWLEYNGKLDRVDYIGKYENLSSDLKIISKSIDIDLNNIPLLNYNNVRNTYSDMYDFYKKDVTQIQRLYNS